MPAWASRPWTVKGMPVGGGRARDQLVDAVHVEDQARVAREAAGVEVLGAQQPVLLADREHHLEVPVRDAGARGARGSPPGWPPRPPCRRRPARWCRRCGSCRPRPRVGWPRPGPRCPCGPRAGRARRPASVPGKRASRLPVSPPIFSPASSTSTLAPMALRMVSSRRAIVPSAGRGSGWTISSRNSSVESLPR